MIQTLLLLAGAVLVGAPDAYSMMLGYLVLSGASAYLSMHAVQHSVGMGIYFAATQIVSLGLVPGAILWFVRDHPQAGNLRPWVSVPARLFLAAALLFAAKWTIAVAGLSALPNASFALYGCLCGVGALIVHRNLLAHVIGLLALGSAITLAGCVLAPGFGEGIDLGLSFDAMISTFTGLALARAFATHDPSLDVAALRMLRG